MTAPVATSANAAALLVRARAFIAHEMLDLEESPVVCGDVRLHPHQRRAVARIRALLRGAGGAMLADATGLGKTFVALAVAARFDDPLIIVPAALLDAWRRSAARVGLNPRFLTIERLSRGPAGSGAASDLIVVDESHHLRNPRTKRYGNAAALCDGAGVLLLSATPLQNRREDLVAQIALFLGDAALSATDAELARYIVRRRAADAALPLPNVSGPHEVVLPVEDDLLDELIALPPPVPAVDEGVANALVTYTLLRQWASSRAALTGGLRRRLAKALALLSSFETGHWPKRDDLLAWSCAADAMQLAMPELFATIRDGPPAALRSMHNAVQAHADGLRALLTRLRVTGNPDSVRASTLDQLCRAHPNASVIAFSQYAETVREISRLLMPRRPGVAELTARGGRVAGGRVSRGDVLAQFAPSASRDRRPTRDRITLLVTTDVLSEGLDLQRASVVVHLDLPWNPARLEQRVGRVRRLGAEHDTIFVYTLAPPASSERVLRVEERLRAKLGVASRVIGLDVMPVSDILTERAAAPPELTSDVLTALGGWRDAHVTSVPDRQLPLFAGVTGSTEGFVALLSLCGERALLAALDGGEPSLDTHDVAAALRMCDGSPMLPRDAEQANVTRVIRQWCDRWSARRALAVSSPAGARVRARISARITALVTSAPRHARPILAMVASRARRALRLPLGAAAERALGALAVAPLADAAWLEAVAAVVTRGPARQAPALDAVPLVIIVLRRLAPGG